MKQTCQGSSNFAASSVTVLATIVVQNCARSSIPALRNIQCSLKNISAFPSSPQSRLAQFSLQILFLNSNYHQHVGTPRR